MPFDEKCWICGADILKSFGAMDVMSRRFCHQHYREHTKQYKDILAQYVVLKIQVMHERALRIMERAGVSMTDYKRYARAVERHAQDNPESYKSSHEMVAAMVMLKNDIDFEMNYKIGTYIVDMYIPDWCLIVEIDGGLHEGKELQDSNRDVKLRQMLGEEWEVIRIPTKYLEQSPEKLPEAIQAMAKQKRKIRKQNGGFLPSSYSKREAERYKKATVYRTVHVPQ